MSLSLEQVWTYLQRIRFPLHDRLPRPDHNTLVQVHDLHTRYVVFENMSIIVPQWRALDMNTEGIKLDVPSLYTKVVKRARGGYSFELNTLFAALLTGMGYTVRAGCSRIVMDGLEVNPQLMQDHLYLMTPYVHQVLFVSGGMLPPGQLYLCDVGYGGNTLTVPMLIPPKDQLMATQAQWDAPPRPTVPQYRLRWGKCGTPAPAVLEDIDQGFYLQIWVNRSATSGEWHDLYYFNLATFGPMDFAAANYFTSTFPQSLFTKGPFCSRPNELGGRFILIGNTLKYRGIQGETETQMLGNQDELAAALRSHFGIEMPSAEEPKMPRFH